VERGAQGSGDGAHVIVSVQTDVCALDREGSARGSSGAPEPWAGAADLSTTLLTIDRWIRSSTQQA
jgi:hypothetical protein